MSAELNLHPQDEVTQTRLSHDEIAGNKMSGMAVPANDTGLADFHTASSEDRAPNYAGRIVGGIVVVLMLVAAGGYLYSISSHAPAPKVTDMQLPNTPPPPPQQN